MYTKLFPLFLGLMGLTISMNAQDSWDNPGSINNNYLDFAHTQKTFNDIRLNPGVYEWELKTQKNNNKPGKVNFDIKVLRSGSNGTKAVDKKLYPGRTDKGRFTVTRYTTNASYGKVKVHIGRAAYNTNVNYDIKLRKVGGLPAGSDQSAQACTYSNLGSKTGTVVGNTVGKYKATKVACKNTARVKVTKTGGKAKTTFYVYVANSKNGNYRMHKALEFPNGNQKNYSKTITVPNAKNKWIKVELKNRSAANTFRYNLNITQ